VDNIHLNLDIMRRENFVDDWELSVGQELDGLVGNKDGIHLQTNVDDAVGHGNELESEDFTKLLEGPVDIMAQCHYEIHISLEIGIGWLEPELDEELGFKNSRSWVEGIVPDMVGTR
jgi:hypothetical protein